MLIRNEFKTNYRLLMNLQSYGVFYLLFRMTFVSNMFGVLEGSEHPQKTQAKVLNANTVSSGNKDTQTPNLL